MSRYYHGTSYHHQRRFIKRVKRLIVTLLLVLLLVGLVLLVDARKETKQATTPSAPTQETSVSYAPSSQIFRTQYFQFQTDKSWKQVQNESTGNRFVYRSFRGTLVEHELTIYINEAAANLPESAYVLPVEPGPNNQLVAGKVSDNCRKAVPPNNKQISVIVTLSEVRFLCHPDSNNYIVTVGLKNGGAPMKLKRAGGSIATYGIIYRNVTANPDAYELQQILNTFQTR